MKRAVVTLSIAAALTVSAIADGGLYLVPTGESGKQTIEDGKLVLRLPVERQKLTLAVLRHDTEDRAILWLELHLRERKDPGDHIVHFEPASKKHWQFRLRGSGVNDGGSKWAMRFDDVDLGKKALKAVAKSYGLKSGDAQDKTEG